MRSINSIAHADYSLTGMRIMIAIQCKQERGVARPAHKEMYKGVEDMLSFVRCCPIVPA